MALQSVTKVIVIFLPFVRRRSSRMHNAAARFTVLATTVVDLTQALELLANSARRYHTRYHGSDAYSFSD